MRFLKGHGTQNDFVILPDPDGELRLTDELVRRVCDRRAGIGADGVLRVVRTGADRESAAQAGAAAWFMDYRNADGGRAEMCGNGARVFARYLAETGQVPAEAAFPIFTRAGLRHVRLHRDGDVTVDMGAPVVSGDGVATLAGRGHTGLVVSIGNPHLACLVTEPVDGFDLSAPPVFDAGTFPDGANLELVHPLGAGHVRMRVYERGAGETRSCGTGTVAAAVLAARRAGTPTGTWRVAVPGGEVQVTLTDTTSLLRGPAVLVAEGELRADWLSGTTGAG